MLIIDTRDADSIEKSLKKYKKKFDQAGIIKQLRSRTHFLKKSIVNRNKVSKAAYTQAYIRNLEG